MLLLSNNNQMGVSSSEDSGHSSNVAPLVPDKIATLSPHQLHIIMTLKVVGTTNQYRLTAKEQADLAVPLAELGLTNPKLLGGAQITAALALDVAASIPGESVRLRDALIRFNNQ